jgi:hypothetical protein
MGVEVIAMRVGVTYHLILEDEGHNASHYLQDNNNKHHQGILQKGHEYH